MTRTDSKPRGTASTPQVFKVVVIDDSEIVLEQTRFTLESEAWAVVTCNSPIGSTLVVARENSDLVLVDVDMASMSGDRVVNGNKSGPRTRRNAAGAASVWSIPGMCAVTSAGARGRAVRRGGACVAMA